jgi:hypothetical protein
MNVTVQQRFCTTKEFRENYFPVSDIKLRDMINREGAPVVKVGRKFLIPIDRFLEWIEKEKIGA